jgi:ABC-type branched-subunit amino acid transport system ATPase component/ABC-type branched-subunit amino acid transport system permease subunit
VGKAPYVELGVVLLALAGFEHFFAHDPSGGQLFNLWMFYSAVVVGFWFVFGAAGQFAFCQAAFIGLGGYAGNLWGGDKNFWLGVLQAMVLCGVISLLFGLIVRKTSHLYFAMVTLGIAEIAAIVYENWTGFTGGVAGIVSGIPPVKVFGTSLNTQPRIFWLLLAFFGVLMLLRIWFERSPSFRDTVAFRDNPVVAATLGIPVLRIRLSTFVLGSVLAGVSGAIYVHWNSFGSPDVYSLDLSVAVLLMLVLGGTNYRWGALIGAWFYTYAFQIIPITSGWQSAIYGGLLMLVILAMPRGVGGALQDGQRSLMSRGAARLKLWHNSEATGTREYEAEPADVARIQGRESIESVADDGAASSHPLLLEARSIRVAFGGVVAVAGVDLDVVDGEIVGLVGPNGSGKTSLLNALTGIVSATGIVKVSGRSIPLGKPSKTRASGIMRTFQAPQNYAELSCLENVLLSSTDRRATGIFASWLARRRMFNHEKDRWIVAEDALARVGLEDLALSHSSELPYGKERLLEMARAIAGRPKLLLLDEPSAGLTASETAQLGVLLSGIRAEGVSMVIVDHKIDFLTPLCDRIVVLDLGEVIASGTPSTVFQDERVLDAYLGGSLGDQ